MVGFLEEAGIEGATVLEVGGGVGEIQIELLNRGAERRVNLELSPAYERFRIRRMEFRTFAHPPSAMLAVLGVRGLDATFAYSGIVWQVTGLAR